MPLPACLFCGTPSALVCSSCRSAPYCRVEHQTEDWKRHQIECCACKLPLPACLVCRTPSALVCSSCRSAPYCRVEHQTDDWPRHQNECRSCKVVSSTAGLFVVATRDINEGEMIVTETPVVVGPSNVLAVPESCLGCFFVLTPRQSTARCPRCGWPVCNVNCPGLKDPAYHGAECEVLTAVNASVKSYPFESILYLRCLLLQKRFPRKWYSILNMVKLAQAISQRSENLEAEIFLQENILKPLASTAPHLIPDCSPKRLKEIYSLLDTFGLPLRMLTSGLLLAVSPIASLMEHSCVPNTRLYFEALTTWTDPQEKLPESRIIVRAVKNIRKAQHLTTYFLSSPLMNTLSRQNTLSTLRNERCTCSRCADPTELGTNLSALKCGTCGSWLLPVDPSRGDSQWKCSGECVNEYTANFASEVLSACLPIVQRLRDQKNAPTVIELEEAVTQLESYLHPSHILCIDIKNRLIKAYTEYYHDGSWDISPLTDVDLKRKKALCVEVLDIVLKPFMREPSNVFLQECLSHLIQVKIEIMERKLSSGEWDSQRVDSVKGECCELFLLANLIATGILSEQQSYDEIFSQIKRALPKMKMHSW